MLLLQSKVAPPRLQRRVLQRPDLQAQLQEAWEVRLTVVQAGTGYGKTTALATLAASRAAGTTLLWYTVEEAERDPQRFLAYLVEAFRRHLPTLSDAPDALLHDAVDKPPAEGWSHALDALLNGLAPVLSGPALLVLDDFHFVADSPEIGPLVERLLAYAPPDLHILLSTRHPLAYPSLIRLRARGELLELDRRQLAFQEAEIAALFRDTYGVTLASREVAALAERSEGWPIALQLVWQRLRRDPGRGVAALLADSPTTLSALFEYLAHDVYDGQSPEIARFLSESAVLRHLTPAACDAVTGRSDSAALLQRLQELDLFVISTGEHHFRYHHLFHDFLRQHTRDPHATRARHRRAAAHFQARGVHEEAIFHLLAAEQFAAAGDLVEVAGEAALRAGRLDTVAGWIDALPPGVLATRPRLQCFLGDLYRLRSRFDEALAWYRQAEGTWRARNEAPGISRALRGQALVYLDTVRPARAEALLEEALRITDGVADRATQLRLLTLLAENKLNMGQPEAAERLRAEARALQAEGPGEDVLSVRVKLRTGRLDEARRILEEWVERERRADARGEPHPPRAHRETVLLLSLICSLMGRVDEAVALAEEGVALGEQMGSPFVTVVAQMRLGHAWQLRRMQPWPPGGAEVRDEAIACYHRAIEMGDRLAVRRTRLEAMWGLARAHGFWGDPASARRAAEEAVEIGTWAGDAWVVALGQLTLGGSLVLAGELDEAATLLLEVLLAFRECGDRFGQAATRLWLSLLYLRSGQQERLDTTLPRLLALVEGEGYEFLFTRPTLHGPPDPRVTLPLLLEARRHPRWRAFAIRLLAELGLAGVERHPGYQLRVRTLGGFGVWRGEEEVGPREWKRASARALFQLLLTTGGEWLQREAIIERLWPERTPEAAARDFKVALSALNKTLEPHRHSDAPYAFIEREGSAYRLRYEADLWVDAVAFESAATRGLRLAREGVEREALDALRDAVLLYQGDYLPDALYEGWASERRAYLLSLFLRAADRLAEALLDAGQPHESLAICARILAHDPCWEHAYRLQMLAHAAAGDRALALRLFNRCTEVLAEQLGVEPAPETVQLVEWLMVN